MGFEPTTFSLARRRSTTEPRPLISSQVGKARFELARIAPRDPKSRSSATSDTSPLAG